MRKISDLKRRDCSIIFTYSKIRPIIWKALGASTIIYAYPKVKKEQEIYRERFYTKFTPLLNTSVRFSMLQKVTQPDDYVELSTYAIIETDLKKLFFWMGSKTLKRKVFFTYPFIIALMTFKRGI
ncbi:MAG: hypothetical protein LWW95_08525 [Candidatus Desulfofervidus auxilii]|nr:hypothetical protein [Candidatus Desulfofervidus auxilii]